MTDLTYLLERLKTASVPNNALDIEIDIALFEPDERYVAVRPNNANTKLVYTTMGGHYIMSCYDLGIAEIVLRGANEHQTLSKAQSHKPNEGQRDE